MPGWGEEFESELPSLSSKIEMFYFFSMKVFKSMRFSKVQMLEELSGGQEGCGNFKLIEALLRTLKRRLSQLKF